MPRNSKPWSAGAPSAQQGITTLAISLMLLVILSVIVLFSTNMAFFDQRTANNENRSRLAEQAAEYSVNIAGEFLKASRERLISDLPSVGWLDPTVGSTSRRWARCANVAGFPAIANFASGAQHPCMSERSESRRRELYFYTTTGVATATEAESQLNSSTSYGTIVPVAARVTAVGGTAAFPATTNVSALLCRVDTSCTVATPCILSDGTSATAPTCRFAPTAGNRVAVTLIGTATLTGEGASATVKEAWGSVNNNLAMSAVPLVASGFVQGLGNAEIVTAPNGGGYGVPVSIWSPRNVCVGGKEVVAGECNGIGSVSTCYVGEFLKSTPESELKTTCATSNNACGCPAISSSGSDYLSGHSGSVKREGIDILDVDGCVFDAATGKCASGGALPDITFFPGHGMDDPNDNTDDSIFEYIFGVDYEMLEAGIKGPTGGAVNQTQVTAACTTADVPSGNCAIYALIEDLGAEPKTCAQINALGASADGFYYVTDSPCTLPSQVGSANKPAIVVVTGEARFNNTLFYGMLFVRSNDNTAYLRGTGGKIFGAVVVEGNVDLAGNITIVYDDTAASGCNTPTCMGKTTKFARLPSSWLDSASGF